MTSSSGTGDDFAPPRDNGATMLVARKIAPPRDNGATTLVARKYAATQSKGARRR